MEYGEILKALARKHNKSEKEIENEITVNEISFNSEDEDVKTKVHVFFVDVANIEESLKELQNIRSK